jgi:hypothetical protein
VKISPLLKVPGEEGGVGKPLVKVPAHMTQLCKPTVNDTLVKNYGNFPQILAMLEEIGCKVTSEKAAIVCTSFLQKFPSFFNSVETGSLAVKGLFCSF